VDFPFKSTKTFHQAFPVAYRQHRADSHCNVTHGYALTIHLEFGGFELDARNWLVDFGGLKGLKGQLEDWFDHKHLVATDDPHIETLRELHHLKISSITEVERTGCEGLSDFIFEHLNDGWLRENGYGDRIICTKVEVRETDANMAMRCLTHQDYIRFCGYQGDPNEDRQTILKNARWSSLKTPEGLRLDVIGGGSIYYERAGYRVGSKYYLLQKKAMEDLLDVRAVRPTPPVDLQWSTVKGDTVLMTEQGCVLDTITDVGDGWTHKWARGSMTYTTEAKALQAAVDRNQPRNTP
jgi:6-pyruvoyltetrahydropterin/6-carboxytetrahydropterin synthase